jgi:hypothetical protein
VRVLFDFTVRQGRITAVDLIGDQTTLAGFDLEFPEPEEQPQG